MLQSAPCPLAAMFATFILSCTGLALAGTVAVLTPDRSVELARCTFNGW